MPGLKTKPLLNQHIRNLVPVTSSEIVHKSAIRGQNR
jgi:hypothetical protein